eukprot:TRINITY_DN37236_c0_g1_i2.p1 TRINITY_DN37236_c0_g1~~TRINITY_DN37236_c0_g1_i2.p1  ORF type:complete len:744 (+),score=170.46 TRINITY_DN37236_c0_g1_i2:52-2283(+)
MTAGSSRLETFALTLQQRLGNLSDMTYVRSDKFVLLTELLVAPDMAEALRKAGFTGPIEVPAPGKTKKDGPLSTSLDPAIEAFIQEVVDSTTGADGASIFEYWGDSGTGSWLRVSQPKKSFGQHKTGRHNSGNWKSSWKNNNSSYGYDDSYNWDDSAADEAAQEYTKPSKNGVAPASTPASNACHQELLAKESATSMLPGWVKRAAEQSSEPPQSPALQAKAAAPASPPVSASPAPPPPRSPERSRRDSEPQEAAVPAPAPCKAWAGCEEWTKPPTRPPPKALATPVPTSEEQAPSGDAGADGKRKGSNKMPDEAKAPIPVDGGHATASSSSSSMRQDQQSTNGQVKVLEGELKSFCPERGFGFIRCKEYADDVYVSASAFGASGTPVAASAGCRVQLEMSEQGHRPRAVSAKLLSDTPESVLQQTARAREPPSSERYRGRLKAFLGQKGFGFIHMEEANETIDVFVHASQFQGQIPDDFQGYPGMPAIGQEVEFCLASTGKNKASWARIVGQALPIDPKRCFSHALSSILRQPEKHLDDVSRDGWAPVARILKCEAMRQSIEAVSPGSLEEVLAGRPPEALLEALEDLSACVAAPDAAKAAQIIGEAGAAAAGSTFHLWLQQAETLQNGQIPEAGVLMVRLAQRPRGGRSHEESEPRCRSEAPSQPPPRGNSSCRADSEDDSKEWWQGGGWEPHELKPMVFGTSDKDLISCSRDTVMQVVRALPTSAPPEVRDYLTTWAKSL